MGSEEENAAPPMFAPWLPPDALRMENIIRVRGISVGEQEDGHLQPTEPTLAQT